MTRERAIRLLLKVLYWLAVLAVSIAVLVGVILLLESRDESSVEGASAAPTPAVAAGQVAATDASRANTMIRLAAL